MKYLDCFLFILFFLYFSFYLCYLWIIYIEYGWNGVYYSYQMLSFLYCHYFLYFYLLLYNCMECNNELIWNEVLLNWVFSIWMIFSSDWFDSILRMLIWILMWWNGLLKNDGFGRMIICWYLVYKNE